MSAAYIGLLQADPDHPDHPDFWPVFNEAYNFWFPNPDDSCYATPVDATGIYKISGYRGTVHLVDFEIAGGTLLPTGAGTLGALEVPAGAPLEKLQNLS